MIFFQILENHIWSHLEPFLVFIQNVEYARKPGCTYIELTNFIMIIITTITTIIKTIKLQNPMQKLKRTDRMTGGQSKAISSTPPFGAPLIVDNFLPSLRH